MWDWLTSATPQMTADMTQESLVNQSELFDATDAFGMDELTGTMEGGAFANTIGDDIGSQMATQEGFGQMGTDVMGTNQGFWGGASDAMDSDQAGNMMKGIPAIYGMYNSYEGMKLAKNQDDRAQGAYDRDMETANRRRNLRF